MPPAKPGHVAVKPTTVIEETVQAYRDRLRANPPPDWRDDIRVPRPDAPVLVYDDGRPSKVLDVPDQRFRPYDVLLTIEDAERIEADALEQYRTPAQQIAYIVHAHFTKPQRPAGPVIPDFIPRNGTAAPPSYTPAPPAESDDAPELLPAYHVGDGSGDDMPTGKGCGKVGVLLTRRIKPGEAIRPGDVFTINGLPIPQGSGIMCGGCGQPIAPASWRIADE